MLRVQFPNSEVLSDPTFLINRPTINCGKDKQAIAEKLITYGSVFWVIMSFKPFKALGMEFFLLFRKVLRSLPPYFAEFFRVCIAYGHIPTAWRHVNVIFIPKVEKNKYFEAVSFKPISLMSFLKNYLISLWIGILGKL